MIHYIVLLYLNLIENRITAKEFNLSAYESWSLDLNLISMEKNALLSLLGIEIIQVYNTDIIIKHACLYPSVLHVYCDECLTN